MFLLQICWIEKGHLHSKYTKPILVLIGISTITLCTLFPINFSNHISYDLRQVPLILLTVYGGYFVGITLLLYMVINHYLLSGFYIDLPVCVATVLLLPFITQSWEHRRFKMRLFITTATAILAACYNIFIFSSLSLSNWHENLYEFYFILMQGGGTWLTTYLVENSLQNIKLREKIMLTDRLNVISELAASVSHEVRNPLTVSKGFLQLLRMSDIKYEKRLEYIDLSLTELERAERIITDYLSMTKHKTNDVVTSNLEKDMIYIKHVLTPYATIHNVTLAFDLHNQFSVTYEKNALRQSLINIIKNGIEAMPKGGDLKIHSKSTDRFVLLTITDTGIGMSKEQIRHLGSPYYTTKEKGTGLGMTVSFNAIHKIGGKIEIDSTIGKGTTFTIYLPISEAVVTLAKAKAKAKAKTI